MTGKMITSELYSHVIITICTTEVLIYNIISFITFILFLLLLSIFRAQESNKNYQKLHHEQIKPYIQLSNIKKQIMYSSNPLTKFGGWFCI